MEIPTKNCQFCGVAFFNTRFNKAGQRIRRYTKEKWSVAKFCSHSCASKQHSNREGTGEQKQEWKRVCVVCNTEFLRNRRTDQQWEMAKCCSIKCLGRNRLGKTYEMPIGWLDNVKQAAVLNGEKHSGKDHWNWKGGRTDANHKLRNTPEYHAWRLAVYARDHFTCQHCGLKCGSEKIVAHHIKFFSDFPDLRYTVSNGLTLCRSCHKRLHKEIGQDTQFKSL